MDSSSRIRQSRSQSVSEYFTIAQVADGYVRISRTFPFTFSMARYHFYVCHFPVSSYYLQKWQEHHRQAAVLPVRTIPATRQARGGRRRRAEEKGGRNNNEHDSDDQPLLFPSSQQRQHSSPATITTTTSPSPATSSDNNERHHPLQRSTTNVFLPHH